MGLWIVVVGALFVAPPAAAALGGVAALEVVSELQSVCGYVYVVVVTACLAWLALRPLICRHTAD